MLQCYADTVLEGKRGLSSRQRCEYLIGLGLSAAAFIILGGLAAHVMAKQPSFSPEQVAVAKKMAAKKAAASQSMKSSPVIVRSVSTSVDTRGCAVSSGPNTALFSANNLILRKLGEYEKLCGGAVTDTLMVFSGMPGSVAQANENATDMSYTLKEFSKFGIKPLVVMEPTTADGLIDFQKFSQGYYDSAFTAYFHKLKSLGITDSMMGTWAPFPESNIPEWGSTNPSQFSTNFVRSANLQKQVFPSSKVSIILDSLSYPPGVLDWDGGAYVSLAPYLQGIPKGLVDSFGYQGFTWAAPAGQPWSNHDAGKFLKPDIAKEAAEILGTNHIWLNTGTYKTFYTSIPAKRVEISPQARSQILSDITAQAAWLQARGFKVTVSLFAENKTGTGEDVDWSYWSGSDPTGPHADILKNFMADLRSRGVGFWLFDSL